MGAPNAPERRATAAQATCAPPYARMSEPVRDPAPDASAFLPTVRCPQFADSAPATECSVASLKADGWVRDEPRDRTVTTARGRVSPGKGETMSAQLFALIAAFVIPVVMTLPMGLVLSVVPMAAARPQRLVMTAVVVAIAIVAAGSALWVGLTEGSSAAAVLIVTVPGGLLMLATGLLVGQRREGLLPLLLGLLGAHLLVGAQLLDVQLAIAGLSMSIAPVFLGVAVGTVVVVVVPAAVGLAGYVRQWWWLRPATAGAAIAGGLGLALQGTFSMVRLFLPALPMLPSIAVGLLALIGAVVGILIARKNPARQPEVPQHQTPQYRAQQHRTQHYRTEQRPVPQHPAPHSPTAAASGNAAPGPATAPGPRGIRPPAV